MLRAVASQPDAGEPKVGNLARVQGYKFRMATPLCLLAYHVLDEYTLKLLMVGKAVAPASSFDAGLLC